MLILLPLTEAPINRMLNQHKHQTLATVVDTRNHFHSLGEYRFFALNSYPLIKITHILKPSAYEGIQILDRTLVNRASSE